MNILIYFCILIITIIPIYLLNKSLNKQGLTIALITMNIISLITSFKYITLSTINLNANSITYIAMFTTIYILIENYSVKETKKIINQNFIITIFTSILLFLMSYHTQSITDTISINMKNVFITNYRVLITYPITTLLSNYILITLYQKMKTLYDLPFITTVTTYLVVGLISNLTYHLGSYLNILTIKTIIKLSLSTYMISLIITIIYSLIMPIFNKKKVKQWTN